MPLTLVDTNVLLDVIKGDPRWTPWSLANLRGGRHGGGLAINMVVYAELAGYPAAPAELDDFLHALGVDVIDLTRPAARLAGRAFNEYRRRGGIKTGVLPDFFIGAHALSQGWTLLTRDAGRYRSYFPGLSLTCP